MTEKYRIRLMTSLDGKRMAISHYSEDQIRKNPYKTTDKVGRNLVDKTMRLAKTSQLEGATITSTITLH